MIAQDHHIHFQRLKESAKPLEIHQNPLHPKQENQDNPLEEMLRYFFLVINVKELEHEAMFNVVDSRDNMESFVVKSM